MKIRLVGLEILVDKRISLSQRQFEVFSKSLLYSFSTKEIRKYFPGILVFDTKIRLNADGETKNETNKSASGE